MRARDLCDPENGLRPGEQWIVDGLDWSWAFVWFQEVPECPGYWLGSNGSLWSFRDNSGKVKDKCRRIKLSPNETGHLKKMLTDTSMKRRMFYIHSLVGRLFNSERPDGMVCRHRDGDPANNHYWNLEWGTRLDNVNDRDQVHKTTARGTAYPHARLNDVAVADMYDMCEAGVLVKDIAAKYGMDKSQTCKILKGEMWGHVAPGRIPPLKGVDGRKRAWRLDPARSEAVSNSNRDRWEQRRQFHDPARRIGAEAAGLRQIDRIFRLMLDGEWRTFAEIGRTVEAPIASVSAIWGKLRRGEFGPYEVDRRRGSGDYPAPWEYRLATDIEPPGAGGVSC